MDKIPYAAQSISDADKKALIDCLDQPWVTRGPRVKAFEEQITEYCDVPYAVLYSSGSVALEAAAYATNIKPGDQLVTSPNTFVGTITGALGRSQNLKFLDIENEYGAPNFDQWVPRAGRTILLPVHYAGIAREFKRPKNTCVIEDACQAFGSRYPSGKRVGSCPNSDLTVFSFHPAKTLCMGEGGLVTTRSKELYERLLLFRNNGIVKDPSKAPWLYDIVDLTNNYNVTEFQAALGLSQLARVDFFLKKRKELVGLYKKRLREREEISFLSEEYDAHSAHNLFSVQIDFEKLDCSREKLMHMLHEKGIGSQVHFIPLYHHTYFKKNFSFLKDDFPKMEAFYHKALSLPLYVELSDKQVHRVCDTLIEILESHRLYSYA